MKNAIIDQMSATPFSRSFALFDFFSFKDDKVFLFNFPIDFLCWHIIIKPLSTAATSIFFGYMTHFFSHFFLCCLGNSGTTLVLPLSALLIVCVSWNQSSSLHYQRPGSPTPHGFLCLSVFHQACCSLFSPKCL